jgi:uroporphyrinogen decarboxylase
MPNLARKNPKPVKKDGYFFFTDEWGITYKKPENSDQYYSRAWGPLPEKPSIEDLESMQWPNSVDEKLFAGLKSKASNYMKDDYAVIMEGLGAGIYETASRIRGPEKFYQDLVKRKDFSRALLNKVFSVKRDFWREAGKRLGECVQIIREGDDLAGQKNMLISPKIYRDLIKPLHGELFEEIKNVFPDPIYVFFHSDGAMKEIIPDLIESGIDILNPIQVSAQGINLEGIGEEFGNRLALWGAGIDTQTELPFESPEAIQSIVKNRLDKGSNYRFVFSAIHNIQKDVPKNNLVSFLDAFWDNRER